MSEMHELIEEIKEDVRLDKLINFWKKYSNFILLGIVAIILFTIGSVFWEYQANKKNQKAASLYEEALRLTDNAQIGKAKEILNSLKDVHDGYKILADFKKTQLANITPAERSKIYLEIASDKTIEAKFRDLSIILWGYEGLEIQEPDTLKKHLEPIAQGESVWKDSALELLGLLAIRQNDLKKATQILKQLQADKNTLVSIKNRAIIYLEQMGALN